MVEKKDLLIEVGTEELPPKALSRLMNAFADGIAEQFKAQNLAYSSLHSFATPRRLAVLVEALDSAQQDQVVQRRGPALKAAYDSEGNPTKAAIGFARSCGIEPGELQVQETPKGAWLIHEQLVKGSSTTDLIPEIVEKSLAALPIPKRMRWGDRNEEFVRPVHWVVLLFGDAVVSGEVIGQQAGRETRGHRFHHPEPIYIDRPVNYASLLRDPGHVIADFNERKQTIERLANQQAIIIDGVAVIDPDLLDEVTALNEWPVALTGSFDESFLEVPAECLIQAMQSHQKYFPVVDSTRELKPSFITISNIQSKKIEQVRAGNERVIRPRFSDAAFFWQQDLKHPLEHHIESLKTIKFQEQLGSLHDKAGRIASLSDLIADQIGLDKNLAMRAAWLCKCDLMTEMVGEFANLQGVMGRYYAEHSGEDPELSQAMEEVYMPRHAGDQLPKTDCGKTIAIADRIDTLVGIFAIGQRPTGAKDPYGLRRAALGVLRIMIETPLDLDLYALLKHAADSLQNKIDAKKSVDEVFDYMLERLKAYYSDQSIASDTVDAVLARRPTKPADCNLRIQAVTAFRKLTEAESLAAANKRIRNILKKNTNHLPDHFSEELLEEDAEKTLAGNLMELTPKVTPLFQNGQYTEGLQLLAALRVAIDDFFDQVMVMSENDQLRKNRLGMLAHLENLFLSVADLSRLQ
jgi:glycyl-tRNA synthetase beta chain